MRSPRSCLLPYRCFFSDTGITIVASTYPGDKKDFRFLPQILNSESQILNNIEYQNHNDNNSEAFFDNAPFRSVCLWCLDIRICLEFGAYDLGILAAKAEVNFVHFYSSATIDELPLDFFNDKLNRVKEKIWHLETILAEFSTECITFLHFLLFHSKDYPF